MLPVGTRVGDYEIEAELGAGGMATVYRARHALLESSYALKVLDPRYRASPEARARFLDEAKIQHTHLDHPNIVKVVNVVATPEHAALVMELVEGPALEDVLGELRARPDEVRRIMLAILGAVGHAHAAGIVHRDLKPANVLLQRKGDRLVPKVTDFGIAKLSAALAGPGKRSTQGDRRMGTLGYMSPEQLKRAKDVTARSDIFSLGVMLYELATGASPFDGDHEYEVMDRVLHGRYPPPEQRAPAIDPVVAAVIRRALAVDPADRFASCEEMAAALSGQPPPAAAPILDLDVPEWVDEPTPVPTPSSAELTARVAAAASRRRPPPEAVRKPDAPAPLDSWSPAFDLRSPELRSLERLIVPVGAGLAVAVVVVLLVAAVGGRPVAGVLLGLAFGGFAAVQVDALWRRRQFRAASTIVVRVEAKAEHGARVATVMRDLGFVITDGPDRFRVTVPNQVAIDALFTRCQRDLQGLDHFPPAERAALESAEGFGDYLAKLLAVLGIDRPGGAPALVDVVQWDRS